MESEMSHFDSFEIERTFKYFVMNRQNFIIELN